MSWISPMYQRVVVGESLGIFCTISGDFGRVRHLGRIDGTSAGVCGTLSQIVTWAR
jgi:hypothetical protein